MKTLYSIIAVLVILLLLNKKDREPSTSPNVMLDTNEICYKGYTYFLKDYGVAPVFEKGQPKECEMK